MEKTVSIKTSKNVTMYSDGKEYWRKTLNPVNDSYEVEKVEWQNENEGYIESGTSRQLYSKENLEILFEEQFRIHHIAKEGKR